MFQLAQRMDKSFINSYKHAVDLEIAQVKVLKHQQLNQLLRDLPQTLKNVNICGLKRIMDKAIPIYAIRVKTEKLLRYQQLGHPCKEYL